MSLKYTIKVLIILLLPIIFEPFHLSCFCPSSWSWILILFLLLYVFGIAFFLIELVQNQIFCDVTEIIRRSQKNWFSFYQNSDSFGSYFMEINHSNCILFIISEMVCYIVFLWERFGRLKHVRWLNTTVKIVAFFPHAWSVGSEFPSSNGQNS